MLRKLPLLAAATFATTLALAPGRVAAQKAAPGKFGRESGLLSALFPLDAIAEW